MRLNRVLFVGLAIIMTTGVASAVTWNVAPTGCNDNTCTPCCTIHAAVEKSSGGDTISIGPGTYPEQVDIRDMLSVGDITLEAAAGPGTVLVAPSAGVVIRHAGFDTNTVTIDGINVTSPDESGFVLAHSGDVVLRDANANGCGYTAFQIDATGTVTLERCTGNSSARTGIQIDGAASTSLTDCTGNTNPEHGIYVLNVSGTVEIVNPTTIGNTADGVKLVLGGSSTISGATITDNGRWGIAGDNAGSVGISSSTVTGNADEGIYIYYTGVNLVDGITVTDTTVSNNGHNAGSTGLRLRNYDGPVVIDNCDINDNGDSGMSAAVAGTIEVLDSTFTGNVGQGIDVDMEDVDPVDGVTLTNTEVNNNGHGSGDSGVRLRNVNGPVVITNSDFNDNGWDGFSPEDSVVGDLEIYGGEANGNVDDGYDLRVNGNATVIGARANTNGEHGIIASMPGTVFFQDCVANGNQVGSGIYLEWQDPDSIDGASVVDCTANDNGLAGGGNGIIVNHVAGPVTVIGTTTNGNSRTGVRVDNAGNTVLIKDAESNFGLEEGIKIDADVGPVTVLDCLTDGNAIEGLKINSENVDVESVFIIRNTIVNNGATGVVFNGLGGSGPFKVKCNDLAGNTDGMYLPDPVTVDARHIWWGDPTGPAGQGPGAGDTVYAEPGGTISFDPWLTDSFAAPVSGCPLFESDFESGSLGEWDVVVQ
jgi:hypothetical protein